MEFYIAAATDAGTKRRENQDRFFAERFDTSQGAIAFAVLCDGMGGLERGEVASASIVEAFSGWARAALSERPEQVLQDHVIRRQWTDLIDGQNSRIRAWGQQNGCRAGSTVTALLLTEERYYILNIGDSRAYELAESARRLTEDHTVLADEIRLGNIREEQALTAPIRNVLTKCVGVAPRVYPDFFFGETREKTVYMLCSDGFRHLVTEAEMLERLRPETGEILPWLEAANKELIERNKRRGETDNISVVTIYTESRQE